LADDENLILGDFASKLARYFVLAVDESKVRGVFCENSGKLKIEQRSQSRHRYVRGRGPI
jgi:hypothetical protein